VKTGIQFLDLLIRDPCLRRDDKTGRKALFPQVGRREKFLEVTPLKSSLPAVAFSEGGGIGWENITFADKAGRQGEKTVSKPLFLVL
jgi:hypothetical protein